MTIVIAIPSGWICTSLNAVMKSPIVVNIDKDYLVLLFHPHILQCNECVVPVESGLEHDVLQHKCYQLHQSLNHQGFQNNYQPFPAAGEV